MATTLNITDNFTTLVSKFNELSSGVGDITGLDIAGESDISNILTSIYALIDSDTDFRSKISVTDAGGDGSLAYNNSTGVFTYTGPSAAEVRAHLSAGGDLSYNSTTGQFSVTTFKTADARASISVTDAGGDGGLSYNSGTGVITYTGPSAAEVRTHFTVTDAGGDGSLTYNSGTGVITYTGPSPSQVRAHFTGGSGITLSSGDIAITSPVRFRLFDSTGATILDLYGAGSL